MTLSYTIDKINRLVFTTATGFVTLDQALELRQQLLNDPEFNPDYSQLIDLTGVTGWDLTANQIRLVAEGSAFSFRARRALVGDNPLVFGLARMYEIVRGLRGDQYIRVFHTCAEALAWIREESKAA